MVKRLSLVLFLLLLVPGFAFAQIEIDPSFQVKYSPLAAGEAILGASSSQTVTSKSVSLTDNTVTGTLAEFNTAVSDATLLSLTGSESPTNKTIDGDLNTIQDLAISSLKTVIGNAEKIIGFDASGVPTATDTLPAAISVLADSLPSLDFLSSLTDTPSSYSGASLKAVRVNVGETALEFYTPSTGASAFAQEDLSISGATSTITLTSITTTTLADSTIFFNGIAQKNSDFTRTNSTQFEYTVGNITDGTDVKVQTFN